MAPSTVLLARYRPAILTLTAIAAGCTIFYIHNSFWSLTPSSHPSSGETATPLQRSNARRRNRQSRHTDHSDSYAGGEQSGLENGSARNAPNARAELEIEAESTSNSQSFTVAGLPAEVDALESEETLLVSDSEHSWRDETEAEADSDDVNEESQSLLNLLYRIAEEQARKEGYVHRGVTCNSCNTNPIKGIRYRCTNCVDFDLCEQCEAMQIHPKTHLFYKVRIPAPFLGNPRQPQPVWYPGKPSMVNQPLPKAVTTKFCKETGFQIAEIEALWEQFRCLANAEFVEDPNQYYLAIDRQTFDKCFVPNTSSRPTPPNLICDRLFAFYDTNNDGLIGFDEFLNGLSSLTKQKSHHRRKKIFDGYDINQDGYVDRKDFLRMFRAFYALSKELTKEIVTAMDEDTYEAAAARDIVRSSQPISSAFSGPIPLGERSRTGEGKTLNENGDKVLSNHGVSVVRESGEDTGDHNEIVADSAEAARFGNIGDEHTIRYGESMLRGESRVWPPTYAIAEDVNEVLHRSVALEDIIDPLEREKVRRAALQRITNNEEERRLVRERGIRQRWQRQQYYIDEENGAVPPDDLKNDETSETQTASRRSRSSSKVRFQDDLATDEDHETRSVTSMSSRSIPVGERWGGYEVPEAEKDVGREILYQVTQEALNELLDPIFRQREDFAIVVRRTEPERKHFRPQITSYSTDQAQRGIKEMLKRIQMGWRNPAARAPKGEVPALEFLEGQFYIRGEPSSDTKFEDGQAADQATNRPTSQPNNDQTSQPINTSNHQAASTQSTNPAEDLTFPSTVQNVQNHPTPSDERNADIETATPNSTGNTNPSLDPTFPQNRLNMPSSPSSQAGTASTSSHVPLTVPPPPPSTSTPHPSTSTHPQPPSTEISVSRMVFLIACDQIGAEDEARGGPGRLNFEEFLEVLNGPKGASLGFVGEWLEMARF